jgi:mannose-6-phosphate isomerase-like protein (cupin superfamily)
MDILHLKNAPKMECCKKAGLLPHVLFDANLEGIGGVNVTWVDVEPGKSQTPHEHTYDQIYILIAGSGLLTVENETAAVGKGERIHIPNGKMHGIKNEAKELLSYISVSAKE